MNLCIYYFKVFSLRMTNPSCMSIFNTLMYICIIDKEYRPVALLNTKLMKILLSTFVKCIL